MTRPVDQFSRAFYPFLHADDRAPRELMEDLRLSLLEKARESVEVKSRFFAEQQETILQLAQKLAQAFHRGRKLLRMRQRRIGYRRAAHRRRVHAPDHGGPQSAAGDLPQQRHGDGHGGGQRCRICRCLRAPDHRARR